MKSLTVEKLVEIVRRDYDLTLRLNAHGEPVLVGPKEQVTEALLQSLKAHKVELIAYLLAKDINADPLICYKFPDETLASRFLSHPQGFPSTAIAWRIGNDEWRPMIHHPKRRV